MAAGTAQSLTPARWEQSGKDVGPHSDGAVALAASLGVVRYFVQMGLGCTQVQPIGGYYPGSPLSSSDHTGALLWSSSGSRGVRQCL